LVPARQHGVDVTDPVGAAAPVFAQMAAEIDDALAPVVQALLRIPKPPAS
jgi:hypothetical protein